MNQLPIVNWICLRNFDPPKDSEKTQPILSSTLNTNSTPVPLVSSETEKAPSNELDNQKSITDKPSNTEKVIQTNQKQPKTFAQALSNLCDIPTSQLPQPVLKGDNFAISIPEEEVDAGINTCKFNLHARVIWPKGSTPLTAIALRAKISQIWKNLKQWGLTTIGKGYFEFSFSCLEDVKWVRSTAAWNLNPGVLKFFAWTRDFNPKIQNTTSAQVWLRIHGLPQEYWRPKILFAIANSVGTPICTDSASTKPMMERTFGLFTRVLVDMDITQQLWYKVLVERKNFAFFVELEYENLPEFCLHCMRIGHNVDYCRLLTRDVEAPGDKKKIENVRKNFKVVNDGRTKQRTLVQDPIVIEDAARNTNKAAGITAEETNPIENLVNHNKDVEAVIQNNRFEV